MTNTCRVCGVNIRVMIFRGTGYCSDNCRKIAHGEAPSPTPSSERDRKDSL